MAMRFSTYNEKLERQIKKIVTIYEPFI